MNRKISYLIVLLVFFITSAVLVYQRFYVAESKADKISFRAVNFSQLPGWKTADAKQSLVAFQISCKAFLKQDPEKSVGTDDIAVKVGDFQPACRAASKVDASSNKQIYHFFQTWFTPYEFFDKKPVQGLFTGYYMPLLKGSLKKTKRYHVPLYGLPTDLVIINLGMFDPNFGSRTLVGRIQGTKIVPYYTRAEINKGSIKEHAPVIAWVDNLIDRSFLEIQGSGIIGLSNGKRMGVGYIGENGSPYTAIAKVLIDKGVMTRDNASMQHIRSYLQAHPDETSAVLNQNKSFVFFNTLSNEEALGAQGVPLTPGYSLAVDRKWVPLGTPIWLDTTRPHSKQIDKEKSFQRLMIAQDTGGAIKGVVRGDVYWGAGEKATAIAGRMKNQGHYWLLLPKAIPNI
jgi:membrane-bound lytic murein transglycosylase A